MFVLQAETLHEVFGKQSMEPIEGPRKPLSLLISARILRQLLTECDVGDETAVPAKSQCDIAARKLERGRARIDEQTTIDRYLVLLKKDFHRMSAATATTSLR